MFEEQIRKKTSIHIFFIYIYVTLQFATLIKFDKNNNLKINWDFNFIRLRCNWDKIENSYLILSQLFNNDLWVAFSLRSQLRLIRAINMDIEES